MAKKEKNRWIGIVLGPCLTVVSLCALWKNETRFDYHKAAAATTQVNSLSQAYPNQLLSFTGEMDQQLSYPGGYVDSFTGYLTVERNAEIYAWDEDRDDDHTTWTLRWMSSVESNSRNSGVTQVLSSTEFYPPEYHVGELIVEKSMIEFVDSYEDISTNSLVLSQAGTQHQLKTQGQYFHLSKGKSDRLGDERVSYIGIPVPPDATYFGKFSSNHGVADTTHQRTGVINQIIQDTGILHHIVAGERDTALATMKAHIKRLKWIVRGIGTLVVMLGVYMFFATIVGFLFHIPVIGRIAETGAFLLAIAIGLPLAFVTIATAYLVGHPLLLAGFAIVVIASILWMYRRGKNSQLAVRSELESEYGRELGDDEIKELEFIELVQVAMSDSKLDDKEDAFLRQWSKKHGWGNQRYDEMIHRAKTAAASDTSSGDDHLNNLVRLAMADGKLTSYEMTSIRGVCRRAGYDEETIRQLIERARSVVAG